jgi:hypothetical protein
VAVAVPAAFVAIALRVERAWVGAIVDGAAPNDLVARSDPLAPEQPSFLAGRLDGIWHSTLSGAGGTDALRWLLPLLVVAAIGAVLAARRSEGPVPEVALGAALAVGLLAWAADPISLIEGFVPAAPILVLGAVAALALRRAGHGVALLATATGLFLLALYATQYPDGGAFQWGGRFLMPVVVPLAALAAVGLGALLDARPAPRRRTFGTLLAAVAVASAVHGVAAVGSYREGVGALYQEVEAAASPVNVTSSDLLPRLMWREDLPWLRATNGDLDVLLEHLREEGVERVTVVAEPEEHRAATRRWSSVDDRGPLGGTPLHITVLER